jgi:transposase
MAYSIDYRKRAVEYYHEGNWQAEVKAAFKIHPSTLRDWEARYMAGNLEPNYAKDRKKRKLPTDELISYVEENPDAFLKEIGEHFGCSHAAVHKALKKLNITLKKRYCATRKDVMKSERSIKKK